MDRPDRDNIIIEGTIRLKEAAQKTVELESNRLDRYKVADNEGDERERDRSEVVGLDRDVASGSE